MSNARHVSYDTAKHGEEPTSLKIKSIKFS